MLALNLSAKKVNRRFGNFVRHILNHGMGGVFDLKKGAQWCAPFGVFGALIKQSVAVFQQSLELLRGQPDLPRWAFWPVVLGDDDFVVDPSGLGATLAFVAQ